MKFLSRNIRVSPTAWTRGVRAICVRDTAKKEFRFSFFDGLYIIFSRRYNTPERARAARISTTLSAAVRYYLQKEPKNWVIVCFCSRTRSPGGMEECMDVRSGNIRRARDVDEQRIVHVLGGLSDVRCHAPLRLLRNRSVFPIVHNFRVMNRKLYRRPLPDKWVEEYDHRRNDAINNISSFRRNRCRRRRRGGFICAVVSVTSSSVSRRRTRFRWPSRDITIDLAAPARAATKSTGQHQTAQCQ